MFAATGRHFKDLHLSINRRKFKDSYSLCLISLLDDGEALSTVSSGTLRLEMRFRVPLSNTTTLVVYAFYDSVLEINSGKKQVLVYNLSHWGGKLEEKKLSV